MYYEFHSLKPAIRPFYNHKILQKEVAYDGHCFHIIVNWRRSIHKCQVHKWDSMADLYLQEYQLL